MSVDLDCGIIVGLPYDEIVHIEEDNLDEMIADGELEVSSSHYDSDPKQNIVGFWAVYGQETEFDLVSLSYDISEAKAKFFERIGQEGKVYIALHIT